MAGRLRRGGRWAVSGVVAALVVLTALLSTLATMAGWGRGPDGPDPDARAIQRLLERRADAVRERDEGAFLATVDRVSDRHRAAQRRMFDNLSEVPLSSLKYRFVRKGGFVPVEGTGRRIAAQVELRYQLAGYDTAPVVAPQRVTLAQRGHRWYVAAIQTPPGTAPGAAPEAAGRGGAQLWDQGRVSVVRGRHSLVLGVGQDRHYLRGVADTADSAVPAVRRAWPAPWAGRVVVLVPGSLGDMAALLGGSASGYRGIAAVTTGEIGGAGTVPADRVIINPDAYDALGDLGRQVVMTHEATHVATRAHTSTSTPLWLSEGLADWVGYRETRTFPRQVAPELTRAVEGGQIPHALPGDDDFGFAGDGNVLAQAYEQGWLACRMIAEQWGERKLVAFYRAVGAAPDRDSAVRVALRTQLHVSEAEFTRRWRGYLKQQLAAPPIPRAVS
ncbi:hypothetical protein [Streptomyces sp. NPDC057702]|uniref:hypothetical protein n=1 Tax=unclassified Streptomyces TaxID=2593676 RepID=UPI00368E901B